MRVSIIVADKTVYVDGKSTQIDLPEKCNSMRALQWNEKGNNSGHIELIDGTNIDIDEQKFAEFFDVIDSAQKAIAKQESGNGFTIDRYSAGVFYIYKVFAKTAGAVTKSGDGKNIERGTQSIRVSMVTKGSRQYASSKGYFAPVTLNVGDFNLDLPNMEADDEYTVTALEDNTEYHCISRQDLMPFDFQRFSVSAGNNIIVPAGKYAFIGGGVVNGEKTPKLFQKSSVDQTLIVIEGTAFGIIF